MARDDFGVPEQYSDQSRAGEREGLALTVRMP